MNATDVMQSLQPSRNGLQTGLGMAARLAAENARTVKQEKSSVGRPGRQDAMQRGSGGKGGVRASTIVIAIAIADGLGCLLCEPAVAIAR